MSDEVGVLLPPLEYTELLVRTALKFNRRTRAARRVRAALLITALQQIEVIKTSGGYDQRSRSE